MPSLFFADASISRFKGPLSAFVAREYKHPTPVGKIGRFSHLPAGKRRCTLMTMPTQVGGHCFGENRAHNIGRVTHVGTALRV